MSSDSLDNPQIRLFCESCDYVEFSSYSDFNRHHLRHIRQPNVSLSRLSPTLVEILNSDIYRLGLKACLSRAPSDEAPSLELSIVKDKNDEEFVLVRKKGKRDREPTNSDEESTDNDRESSDEDENEDEDEDEEEEEEKYVTWAEPLPEIMQEDMSERLEPRVPISRKGKAGPRCVVKSKPASTQTSEKDNVSEKSFEKIPNEDFLQKLREIGGFSASTCQLDSSAEDYPFDSANEPRPSTSGVTFPRQHKPLDLSDYRNMSDDDDSDEDDRKVFDDSNLLNINGSGVYVTTPTLSHVPRMLIREPYVKLERIDQEPQATEIPPAQTPRRGTRCRRPSLSSSGGGTPAKKTAVEPENTDEANDNAPPPAQRKRKPRGKGSNRGRKKRGTPQKANKRNSKSKSNEEQEETPEEATEQTESTPGPETSADQTVNREDTGTNTEEPPRMPSTSTGAPIQMDLLACLQPTPQAVNNNANSGNDLAAGSTLISPNPKVHDAENSNFVAEADEVRESFCESMTGDNRDARRGPQQPIEQAVQAALWATLQRANSQSGNNQDPALGHNNQMPGSQAINVSFLQNLLAEHQAQRGSIPADNSEFVSLERLAQHQPQRFDMNNVEVITPMEQLTHQVNRLSNPAPQVNVMSHMQPPPPLHAAGVPLPHPSTSFNGLGRMQPPMGPPPLFQAFNLFPNPGFQQQGSSPQVIPRPPALKQCPQIQAYQNQKLALAQPQPQPQQTRSKGRAGKRSLPKPAPAAEPVAPKTRRSQSAAKEKPQAAKAKAPTKASTSGKAPAKRTAMDPQTVASVLAARGITVTPSTSRPANAAQAPKKTNVKTCSSSPVINISSAITITPSSQKKEGSGKKKHDLPPPAATTTSAAAPATALATASSSSLKSAAVMGQWRNCTPLSIINHNGGRHKECITIDLTADDEVDISMPGPSANRFECDDCEQKFPTAASLELHMETHRGPELTFECEDCDFEFSTAEALEEHRNDTHKYRGRANNWVIPIVDLDFPGAEDRLLEYGVTNFIPVSLGDGTEGNFAIPIISQETPRGPRSFLGVSNVIVLGQMRSFFGPRDE